MFQISMLTWINMKSLINTLIIKKDELNSDVSIKLTKMKKHINFNASSGEI